MGITSFQPACNLAKDFIARACERDLAANLVPALTASGQLALGVVVENSIQAHEMGQIFGNDFGPISIDSWRGVQILTFPATTILRIE
jgi:hypothetical protein